MIDLHTHTFFSDGALIPSEQVRRADALGLTAIGLTDHGDLSNIDFIVPRLVAAAESLNPHVRIRVVPGVEITHVPPAQIGEAVRKARELGARVVVVHGETVVEPVAPGTNRAAIEAGVDILAHPGLITEEEVRLARENGVCLEITARGGHSLTNGHVAALAKAAGCPLVVNTDAHAPKDLMNADFACLVVRGAGLTPDDFDMMQTNARDIMKRRGM